MANQILKQSRSPLYLQLTEVLRQELDRGRWREGDFLPTVEQLAQEYDVAKVTVRQAIKLLEEDRRVEPRRGRGTTVLQAQPKKRPLNVQTRLADLINMYQGDVPELVPLEENVSAPPIDDSAQLMFDSYYMMKRMHARDEQHYCVITIYIAEPIFRRHEDRFRQELALPVLDEAQDVSINSARQTLKVSKCDMQTAGLLDLGIGEPIAEVRRTLYDKDGRLVYLADVIYRGDYIRLDMDLLA